MKPRSRDSVVVIAIRLRAGHSGVRISARIRYFSPKRQYWLWAHTASCRMRTGVLSREWSGQGVKLTIDLNLVPRLRISGVIRLLPCMPSCCGQGHLWLSSENRPSWKEVSGRGGKHEERDCRIKCSLFVAFDDLCVTLRSINSALQSGGMTGKENKIQFFFISSVYSLIDRDKNLSVWPRY
jgi:hypothetical protein